MLAFAVACTAPHSSVLAPAPAGARPHLSIETPVWIDGRFRPWQRDQIEKALARWNAALGGERVFVVASDELDRPHDWLQLSGAPMSWGVTITAAEQAPAYREYVLAEVVASDVRFYADHMQGQSYEWVAMHELGHVLGLADNEQGASLMSRPLKSGCECIDTGTIAAIGARRLSWTGALTAECP